MKHLYKKLSQQAKPSTILSFCTLWERAEKRCFIENNKNNHNVNGVDI